jgi:P27 family predicted phage terminase small subunit
MSSNIAIPEHLPESARGAWAELSAQLSGIEDMDSAAFEALATALARARSADARIAQDGEYLTHSNGHVYAHPALRISQRSWADFRQWAARFQLTPKDRGEKRHARTFSEELDQLIGVNPRAKG